MKRDQEFDSNNVSTMSVSDDAARADPSSSRASSSAAGREASVGMHSMLEESGSAIGNGQSVAPEMVEQGGRQRPTTVARQQSMAF